MECHAVHHKLIQYITGNISTDDKAGIKTHLRACSACSAQYATLLKTWETLSGLPEPPEPFDMSAGVLARIDAAEHDCFSARVYAWFRDFRFKLVTTAAAALFAGLVIGTAVESYRPPGWVSPAIENDIYSEFFYDISPFSIAGSYSELLAETEGG